MIGAAAAPGAAVGIGAAGAGDALARQEEVGQVGGGAAVAPKVDGIAESAEVAARSGAAPAGGEQDGDDREGR